MTVTVTAIDPVISVSLPLLASKALNGKQLEQYVLYELLHLRLFTAHW